MQTISATIFTDTGLRGPKSSLAFPLFLSTADEAKLSRGSVYRLDYRRKIEIIRDRLEERAIALRQTMDAIS
jgi:hypothetical protein